MTSGEHDMRPIRLPGPDHEPLPYTQPIIFEPSAMGSAPARRRGSSGGLIAAVMVLTLTAAAATAILGTRQELGEGRSTYVARAVR